MGKNRCGDEEEEDDDLIQKILVRLPAVSLLRFKSVCKSWCALIQSPSFIHLHTTFKSSSSSSSNFGSFILHAAVDFEEGRFREDAVFMFSSETESECCVSRSRSWCSKSFGLWTTPGFNGICGRCAYGPGGWWWRTTDGFCGRCCKSHNYVFEENKKKKKKDDQVSKMDSFLGEFSDDDDDDDDKLSKIYGILKGRVSCDNDHVVVDNSNNNYLGGGGGGGVGVSNDNDDDEQQQQLLVLKLENLGFPSCYNFGKPHMVMVVGSCNGLICLHDSERSDVSLWNPATKQFRILPKALSITIADANDDDDDDDDDCPSNRLFAFGFDDETKDYKVVLLSGFRLRPRRIIDDGGLSVVVGPKECFCRVQVYSLSTDSWRLLEGITVLPGAPFPYPPDSSSGQLLYLNGSCFFMAKFLYSEEEEEEEEECIPPPKDNDRFIISLDFTKEIIIPIQLPDHHAREELYLCYLSKRIALFTKKIDHIGTGYWERFCIWVLKEHCSNNNKVINDSWTEIHWFPIQLGLPGEQNIPRGISNDGVFVWLETGIPGELGSKKKKMKLYNLATKKFGVNGSILPPWLASHSNQNNFMSCDQVLSKAYAYKPSLVSIIGEAAAAAAAESASR